MIGQNALKLRKNESWLAQLHVRETVLLILDGCPLLSTDKISQHCYMLHKLYSSTAPCQISTWFNTDIAISQQETTRPWQRARPLRQQACVPPPSVMSAGFRQKPQGASFIMETVDEETISAQSQRSEKHLSVASTELLRLCYIIGTTDANANLLSFYWESSTTCVRTHPAKKTLWCYSNLKRKAAQRVHLFFHRIFFKQVVALWQALTRARRWPFTPIHLILLQRGTQQWGYDVTFVVTVSWGSLVTGDTNRNFPGESSWPWSLPSVHTALPNPVSPERELSALYRWIDRGWMTRQVSNVTRRKHVSVLSMVVTHQAWVEPGEATHVKEKGSIHWRQWTAQLDLLSLYAVAECVVTSNI